MTLRDDEIGTLEEPPTESRRITNISQSLINLQQVLENDSMDHSRLDSENENDGTTMIETKDKIVDSDDSDK